MVPFRRHGKLAMTESSDAPPSPPEPPRHPDRAGEARGMLAWLTRMARTRDLRRHYFDPAFAADAAWDLLIALAIARLEGRSIDTAPMADGPAAAGMRSIRLLVEQGYCEIDEAAGTAPLRFTARGWEEMRRYVQAATNEE